MKLSLLFLLSLIAAGNCLAQGFVNNFATPPVLNGTGLGLVPPVPGEWNVNRYAPATFTNTVYAGVTALDIGVSASDYNIIGGQSFYNTQGRAYNLTGATLGSSLSAKLFVPSAWAGMQVNTGLWSTADDAGAGIAGYPIIAFFSDGTSSYFEVWDDNIGYVPLPGVPIHWDGWNTLLIQFTDAGFVYSINGTAVYTNAAAVGAASFADVSFMLKNSGFSYDAYWTNLVYTSPFSAVTMSVDKHKTQATFTITNTGSIASEFSIFRSQQSSNTYPGPKPAKPSKFSQIVTTYTLNGANIDSAFETGAAAITLQPGKSAQVVMTAKIRGNRHMKFNRTVRVRLTAVSRSDGSASASADTALTVKANQ